MFREQNTLIAALTTVQAVAQMISELLFGMKAAKD